MATLALGLAGWVGFGAWAIPDLPARRLVAVSAIACPASYAFVDPELLQAAIDEDLREATALLQSDETDAAASLLVDIQTQVCWLIRQNPQRGLPWIQLLSASPEAAKTPATRLSLLTISHDLSRLEIPAVRARLAFAAPRWGALMPAERQIILADARTLAQAPFDSREATRFAILGAMGGREFSAALRGIVAGYREADLAAFDLAMRSATGSATGARR